MGITADIGRELSERLLLDGWRVVGIGRNIKRLGNLEKHDHLSLVQCDLDNSESVKRAVVEISDLGIQWNILLSSIGTMEPIGRFFDLKFDDFEQSIKVNFTNQLRFIHGLWPTRSTSCTPNIMLLAGGGTNGTFRNYSAYCVSKIALIKMCELLHDEEEQSNIFIIGPGYTKTRIHEETLSAGADQAGENYNKTLNFLAEENGPGTSFADIYAHMLWCIKSGRTKTGGRNFSTVHDPWREGGLNLAEQLKHSQDAYRLRRHPLQDFNG